MKYICITILPCTVAFLLLAGCQRSSSVSDVDSETLTDSVMLDTNETDENSDETDTETEIETETKSFIDTGTVSAVETGTEDTDSVPDTETDDTGTQGDSEISNSIIGSWIVTSLTVDGEDKPIISQYAMEWEEDGETYSMNAAIFMEDPERNDVIVDGMSNWSPCEGTAALQDSNEIELDLACLPLSSVIIGDACPLECSLWTDDYEAAMNSVTTFEVNGDTLILFNDVQTNVIHFKRSSITSEDLPFS